MGRTLASGCTDAVGQPASRTQDTSVKGYSPITTDAGPGSATASGECSSSQKPASTTGPTSERERDRPDAERPAEHDPDRERAHLERSAHEPDATTRSPRADEHQRVARPGAEVGTDVERARGADQRDPEHEQDDPNRERIVLQADDGVEREQPLDERPDEHGVGDRAEPGRPAERPRDEEHRQPDRDVRHPEGERRVLREALVEHVPRREAELRLEDEDDREPEEEQPEDKARQARDDAAANARVSSYSPNGLIGFGLVDTITLFVSRYSSSASTPSSRPKPDCL